jgi:hypothetical protein
VRDRVSFTSGTTSSRTIWENRISAMPIQTVLKKELSLL